MVRHQHIDDPYIVLNLINRDTSTPEEIKQSYRQLAKKYHPDTWSASCFSEDEKQHATTKFQQISSANTLLTDPIQKLNYDRNYKLGLYDNDNQNDNGSSGNGNRRNNNRSTTDRQSSSSTSSSNNNSNKFQRQQEQNSRHQYSQQSQQSQSQQSQSQQSQQSQIPKRPMGIPPPLPKGWTTITDPISGNLYYYHTRSQRSTWNHPALCSNTASYNTNNTNNTAQAQQTRTSSGNTNYNFGSSGKQQKNHHPNKNKMFGGDFPFNRRPYNNDRYNANSANTKNAAYYNNMDDENINAGGRKVIVDSEPDTHRCGSFLVLILCPPIGILAMYHSIMVTRCWDKSQEQDLSNNVDEEENNDNNKNDRYENSRQRQEELAQGHSSRAGLYACFGNTLGIVFWIYYLFIRGGDESIFEFPKEWNIDEWWPFDFDDK